jgi:hypothetical protein
MKPVSKEEFFKTIGPLDVVVSCEYTRGDKELTSLFKTRAGWLVGYTVAPKPMINSDNHKFFLA